MVDAAVEALSMAGGGRRRFALRKVMRRKSTIAFLMTLPLILLVALLVLYPAFYSIHLATLNKSMERLVGFGNFLFLFMLGMFWVWGRGAQSCLFPPHRLQLQSAHRLHRRALRAQHPEPRPAQVARHAAGALGDPAGDELSRLAVAVRSFLQRVQLALGKGQHRSD